MTRPPLPRRVHRAQALVVVRAAAAAAVRRRRPRPPRLSWIRLIRRLPRSRHPQTIR